jgi:hypothetical protein
MVDSSSLIFVCNPVRISKKYTEAAEPNPSKTKILNLTQKRDCLLGGGLIELDRAIFYLTKCEDDTYCDLLVR